MLTPLARNRITCLPGGYTAMPRSSNRQCYLLLTILVTVASVALAGCASQIVQSEWGRPVADAQKRFPRNLDGFLPRTNDPYVPAAGENYDANAGVEYYLPKRLFEFTFTRELVASPALSAAKDGVLKTASALAAAHTAQVTATAKNAQAASRARHMPDGSKARKDAEEARAEAAGELALAREQVTNATAAFDSALATMRSLTPDGALLQSLFDAAHALRDAQAELHRLQSEPTTAEVVARADTALTQALDEFGDAYATFASSPAFVPSSDCNYKVTMAIKDLGLHPDFRHRFVASLNHNVFREDKLTLKTTANGLLSNAAGKSTDKTSEIVVAIAEAVAAFAGKASGSGAMPFTAMSFTPDPAARAICEQATLARSFVVDPTDLASDYTDRDPSNHSGAQHMRDFVLTKLSVVPDGQAPHQFALRIAPTWQSSDLGGAADDIPCAGRQICDGLFYRRELPHVVSLEQCTDRLDGAADGPFAGCGVDDSKLDKVLATALISMPNASPIARVELNAGPLIATDHTVQFENGMLTSHEIHRPSEMLELASLPIKVARAMLSVVTDLVKLRVDHTSQQTALTTGEVALLKAIEDLKDTQEAIQAGAAADAAASPAPTQ
jgi:hypothetical protein